MIDEWVAVYVCVRLFANLSNYFSVWSTHVNLTWTLTVEPWRYDFWLDTAFQFHFQMACALDLKHHKQQSYKHHGGLPAANWSFPKVCVSNRLCGWIIQIRCHDIWWEAIRFESIPHLMDMMSFRWKTLVSNMFVSKKCPPDETDT